MDKNNKNRTDLLAAGRKRLQQFRQKKDGKGSKSSGKAGKSERNVDADAASSVAIPAEKEPEVQVPDGERPVQDMSPGLLDSSDMHPREKSVVTDIVAETLDHAISVLPEAETAETTLSTVGFPTQDPIVGEAGANSTQGNECDVDASFEERTIRVLDNDMASVPSSETSEISISEGKSVHVGMPVPVDSLAPLDSVNASEPDELVSTRREDISPGLLDSSDIHSRENSLVTNIDAETLDHAISVLPEAETAEATLSTVGFPTQDPIVGEAGACSTDGNECDVNASYEERTTRVLDSDTARASSSETSEKLMSGGIFVHVGMPTPVDSLAPLDSVNASEPGEMPSTRGEDQEAAYSGMEQVDRKSLIVLEGDMNPGFSRFDERTGVQAGIAQADQRMVSTSYEAEPMSQPDGFSAVNTTDGIEVQKIEVHSDSPQLLHILDGISVVSSEHMVQPREDVMAGSVGVEVVILPSSSGYSENTENQGSSSSKILKNTGTCEGDVGPYSLSQLSKVVQGLDEDEFRFLLMERQSATSVQFVNTDQSSLHGYGSSDVLERLKEHLYLTNLEKHMFHLQLSEHLEIQRELDCRCVSLVDEISTASLSLNEVRGQNKFLADELARYRSGLELVACEKEELQRQIHSSKMELDEFSTRTDELQSELERSKLELSNVLEELVDCKDLVAALQVKNESLNGSLSSLTEEREKLAWEKADITLENEKLSRELVECKASLESSHVENVNSSEILALMTEERNKIEEERQSFIRENSKLLADLASWKDLAESLQVENASLNEVLTSLSEDKSKLEEAKEYSVNETRKLSAELIGCTDLVDTLRAEHSNLNDRLALVMAERSRLREENDYLKAEKDKEVVELVNCEVLLTCIQVEYKKVVEDLKEATVCLEHLNEANASLTSSLDMCKAKTRDVHDGQAVSFPSEEGGNKIEPFKLSSTEQEAFVVKVNSQHGFHKGDGAVFSTLIEKSFPNVLNLSSSSNQLQWDSSDDLSEFKALKGCLDQVEQVMQRLEEAVERMYSHSASLSRSGGNVNSSGVSKLIQAFESKAHTDDEELEEGPSVEIQPHSDPYMLTKELTIYMRKVINKLTLEAENASKLVKGERNQKMLSDTALRELKVCHEALQEWNIIVEEANIELVVLYEVVKQHLRTVEAKKGKLLVLYEGSKQQEVILKAENSELERKLNDCESRISKLQVQCEELYRRSDDTVSSINLQLGVLQNEVTERALLLEKELNSTVSGVVKAVGMLDESIGTTHSSHAGDKVDGLDIGSHVAASVEVATTLIKNLQEKLRTVNGDHESLFSSFNELAEKYNDLHEKNALSTDALHKIYGNLEKLIDDSCSSIEESRTEIQNDKWLGLPVISNYNSLMGQLSELLSERLQLRSVNSKLNSELLGRAKDIEELNKRCIGTAHIRKMVGDIEGVVTLEGIEMNPYEPASFLMSLIHFLIEKYKEADEKVSVSKEMLGVKEIKLIELQGQIDDLSFVTLTYKNESLIYMESLRSAMEDLVVVQSEKQLKVTEHEQSEQRVSSLREKLSIAVTKGKGLIVQRDGLKQSLASTSSELEKCMHELQLKDARLHETETKLRTYSEAGARVEALESELSYIRNSATALRESFILKDSVIQRIEEILEDLELPEHFHARDIIEKVDWLARSVTGNSLPYNDWDQKSSAGGGSYADSGFGVTDAWKEDLQPNSFPGDDLRKKYDELQSKFYGLAEQNEMLEQSLMERNNLVQRWEEILDKINMPSQLRSLEPEDRIEWLGGALSEAYAHCDSLQKKIGDMESVCESLTADFEDSQRRLTDLDAALRSVTSEKEHLSAKVEILTQEYDRVSEKATISETENEKLQTNVLDLQSDKLRNEEYVDHVHGDIKRLQDLVREVLQDPNTEEQDLISNSIECLERLLWKLIEKYKNMSLGHAILGDAVEEQFSAETTNHVEMKSRHLNDQDEQDILVLKKELEKALDDLVHVKEERNRHVENSQSLVREVEALEIKGQELQELLIQEEHKSASVKEKLNVAVRKGKSLVQQRDSLRQTIDNVTTEVEHLKSVIELRESAISEYHQKIKAFESESLFMQNRFAETDSELQEKRQTLSRMLSVLAEIDVGSVSSISDPVEKLKHIGKVWRDLHAAMASSEQDSRKSKRAAELLLAELNEVQERNDGLQEELSKVTMELSELSKQRDLEEAAKCESLSRLERLSAIQLQERNKQVSALQVLKSGVDQLRVGFLEIHNIVTDVLPNELELLCNLEASVNSSLKSSDAFNVVGQALGDAPSGLVSCSSDDKVNLLHGESFLGSTTGEQVTDDTITELWSFVGFHLQDFASKIAALKEKLQSHSYSLHKEAICLSETWGMLHGEMTVQKHSFESIKADIARLEITEKETGVENLALRKNISTLYEACKSLIMEIEKCKGQLVENATSVGDLRYNMESCLATDGGDLLSGQTLSFSEECIGTMVNRLLSVVKDFRSLQGEIVEASQMEMKTTISNLQKELREKDIQKDRICVELVSQIKEAEAAAKNYLQELQLAKDQIHDLQGHVNVMDQQCNMFQQRIKDLEDQEATSVDMQGRVRLLTDALAAKEQEIEGLMQALDEEETQMEDLRNKVAELESLLQQKDLELENAEVSRGKAIKKLSVTVSKFDELHHLSATLLSEVEKLQSQLEERDAEISFLREEVTRCTNDALLASKMNKNNFDELWDLLSWLDSAISGMGEHDVHLIDKKSNQVHEYKDILQKKITSTVSELKDLKEVVQSRDNLLQLERSRVQELQGKWEFLEKSLREKESQLNLLHDLDDSGHGIATTSEITEAEPVINKWSVQGTSVAPQVRSLRKINNDQVAIAIDMDQDNEKRLEDEDDDKAHGFKSLTTSKIVPRFTRPVSDMVDGLWVSCDRALMRQPALRLGVIIYWAVLHALLATFVV